jgi:hypothetical protein
MSREVLVSIGLEFPKENKHEVENLIKEKFGGDENIQKSEEGYINIKLFNWELEESDFEEFKPLCTYIGKSEYECLEEECFIWEKEE